MLHVPRVFSVTIVGGFGSPLQVTHESVDPCMEFCLSHHMERRTSIPAVGVIFIAPAITRLANLCNLLSSILLTLHLTLGHQTLEL